MAKKTKEYNILGIDIGNFDIKCVLATKADGIIPYPMLTYRTPSAGIYNGNINDVNILQHKIAEIVEHFTKEKDIHIDSIIVSLNNNQIKTFYAESSVIISRGDKTVTEVELDLAIDRCKLADKELKNRAILHSIPVRVKLDGEIIKNNVIGYKGNKLETKMIFITSNFKEVEIIRNIFNKLSLPLEDIVFGHLGEASIMLSNKQKVSGTGYINMGHQLTNFILYEQNKPLIAFSIPRGIMHLVNDIALVLKISIEEAEEILLGKASFPFSKKRVEEIIESRVEDICENINRELATIDRQELIPGGVLINGGGAHILNMANYFKTYLKIPAKIVTDELDKFTRGRLKNNDYARGYSLTLFAEDIGETDAFKTFISHNFRRLMKKVDKILP